MRLEKGSSPAVACQPWPPAFPGFPPESCQEPHCFLPLAQGPGFCYPGFKGQARLCAARGSGHLALEAQLRRASLQLSLAQAAASSHSRLQPPSFPLLGRAPAPGSSPLPRLSLLGSRAEAAAATSFLLLGAEGSW